MHNHGSRRICKSVKPVDDFVRNKLKFAFVLHRRRNFLLRSMSIKGASLVFLYETVDIEIQARIT